MRLRSPHRSKTIVDAAQVAAVWLTWLSRPELARPPAYRVAQCGDASSGSTRWASKAPMT
jgi:hypothetical protein